ncbi:MAG TPA: site-2 protease family protein [Blastocatellia bacterium]|nr:site-2 protease family protein [Blastocatellia bacterium]
MGTILAIDVPVDDSLGAVGVAASLAQAVISNPKFLVSGLIYSFTVLMILGAHELGHYIACRYYGVDATLPFFIPAPPPVLFGTFGAFIKIKSPFPTRRALFDVGIAGPLAGFAFALPASVVGLLFSEPAPRSALEGGLVFHDPLLFVLIQRLFGLPEAIVWNPIQFAAWVGIFATGLNLLPVGQLDGGHAVAALVGRRGHRLVSIVFFGSVTAIAVLSYVWFGSPAWFLFVALLGLLAFRSHPMPLQYEPEIGRGRQLVAALVALVFLLSFMPFPLTVD